MYKAFELSGIRDYDLLSQLFHEVDGLWDFSSTQVRAEVLGVTLPSPSSPGEGDGVGSFSPSRS